MHEEVISPLPLYCTKMSTRTLGSQWSRLSEPQRAAFVDLFKGLFPTGIQARIPDYSGAKVQYLSERLEGQYAEVRTKGVSDKVEIPMDYRLINKSGRWYAYGIIADGVSVVKNDLSQFEKIIRSDPTKSWSNDCTIERWPKRRRRDTRYRIRSTTLPTTCPSASRSCASVASSSG
jgi:ABC-type transporter MlaC component